MHTQQLRMTSANHLSSVPTSLLAMNCRLLAAPCLSAAEQLALHDAIPGSRAVKVHTDLTREGVPADSLLILTEGWACRYLTTREGGRQITGLLLPGDVVNLDALMFTRPDHSVRTLTHAMVAAVRRDQITALAQAHDGIAAALTWLATLENAVLSRWTVSVGRRLAHERVAHLLCEVSVRLGAEAGNESSFALPLTQEQIADALGLTAVHVNRMMRQLRNHDLIETDGRVVTLRDVARLRLIGGFDPGYLHLDDAR